MQFHTYKVNHRLITFSRKGISFLKDTLHNVSIDKVTYFKNIGSGANGCLFGKREMTCKVFVAQSVN